MVYVTGDLHGSLDNLRQFCKTHKTTTEDIIVVLGDAGFNYYLNGRDNHLKHKASKLPITLFCIRGNHEERPQNVPTYRTELFCGGTVYVEPEYPNLKFAIDGGTYWLEGNKCLVLGGAYSVDKFYRIVHFLSWFPQEQLSSKEMYEIEKSLNTTNKTFNYIFSHTCPYSVRPTHLFLPGIDQSSVDTSMEEWLETLSNELTFDRWYFGHYHDEWNTGNYTMLYKEVIPLGELA